MTRNSPLRLKDLFFPEVSVKARVPNKGQERRQQFELEDLDVSFAFDMSDDGGTGNAVLKLATKEPAPDYQGPAVPYSITIEVYGQFDVNMPEHKDERALWFRKFSAAAALLGAAREQAAIMTSRGPWGTAFMPMITMDVLVGSPPAPQQEKQTTIEAPAQPVKKRRAKLAPPPTT
ncbi:hypothetical protein D3C87_1290930 [compost metagenome]